MSRSGFRLRNVDFEGLVAVGAFGLGVLLLILGFGGWWKVMAVGWFVVLPIIAVLGEAFERQGRPEPSESAEDAVADDEDAALAALRESYATGEITEAEFERRVERLLETESVEEARERIRERDAERAGVEPEHAR